MTDPTATFASLRAAAGEWVDLVRLDDYVADRLARRLRAAVDASAGYLEHGRPP